MASVSIHHKSPLRLTITKNKHLFLALKTRPSSSILNVFVSNFASLFLNHLIKTSLFLIASLIKATNYLFPNHLLSLLTLYNIYLSMSGPLLYSLSIISSVTLSLLTTLHAIPGFIPSSKNSKFITLFRCQITRRETLPSVNHHALHR